MVCERDPDSPNDPAEGRIELVRDGEWLTASGTTLGADDGVAIAAMMALVEDESLPHGPLELLMTVAEEVGLEGANGLDPALVTGSILINLDSEEDGRLTVGCAGSTDTWLRVVQPREACTDLATLSGRWAARSAATRAPTSRRAVRTRSRCSGASCARPPCRCRSGSARSTAARAATRSRATRARSCARARPGAAFRVAVESAAAVVRDTYATTDPNVTVTVDGAESAADAWTEPATALLLDAVALVPTGPLAISQDFAALVETSSSLGEALTEGDCLTLHSLTRSSNDSALPEVIAGLAAAARLAGGTLEVKHNYGGWRPNLDSPALAAAKSVYERVLGSRRSSPPSTPGSRRPSSARRYAASTCSRSARRSSSRTRPTSA